MTQVKDAESDPGPDRIRVQSAATTLARPKASRAGAPGIDEARRVKVEWEHDPALGSRVWVDRWATGLVDIGGDQGLLGQVNGRNPGAVINWLTVQVPIWTACSGVRFSAISARPC
jgi:hypothetical protein